MNTTAAALQAHVTVATIRTWARRGIIAATKQAGRWIIDTASLARRIAIGAMRTRKGHHMLDLTATYTYDEPGTGPVTVTPIIKKRNTPYGGPTTSVRGITPLLADKIDAIADPGSRIHAAIVLSRTTIAIADQPEDDWTPEPGERDHGQLRTTYCGEIHGITIDDVLDLADRIRTQLTKDA